MGTLTENPDNLVNHIFYVRIFLKVSKSSQVFMHFVTLVVKLKSQTSSDLQGFVTVGISALQSKMVHLIFCDPSH